jgi:HEAT repeat protein
VTANESILPLKTEPFNVLEIDMEEYIYKEKDLDVNLSEVAHETIRELYTAARKTAIYSVSHPLTQKAIGRPFLLMEKSFRYKRYFSLHLNGSELFVNNIRIRRSIFSEQITEYMRTLDIEDLVFESGITANELGMFLERFVKKISNSAPGNLMAEYLAKHKINAIKVNGEIGNIFYEKGQKFYGDTPGDFSVRTIVGKIIGNDFARIADMLFSAEIPINHFLLRFGHDYYPQLIRYLIPEKISAITPERLAEILAGQIKDGLSSAEKTPALQGLMNALNYHPEREEILRQADSILTTQNITREQYGDFLPTTSAIKLESAEKIDNFIQNALYGGSPQYDMADFLEQFGRLLRTGQVGKANSVVGILIENLGGNDLDLRRKSLLLLDLALVSYRSIGGTDLVEYIIAKIDDYVSSGKETFEFSDLIWNVAQITLAEKRYDQLAHLCQILCKKCSRFEGLLAYDSLAVKKAIAEMNRREIINQLVWELLEGQNASFPHLKTILTTIGSEEVAFELSTIISHESRQIRQSALKILSELGKASLNVFAAIMEDNNNFEREEGRRELPDARWYIIRNSIFVLGSLRDPEGCRALRSRISDDDIRVRKAIISALEKIAGEQAADLLLIMADDTDREIRELSIIALGLIGQAELTPALIDIAFKHPSEIIGIIATIGKLGGHEAKQFLAGLLNDGDIQSRFTSNRSSRDELKLASIKALGKIGDQEALAKIKEFSESLSVSQKIFFGASKLGKAADDILDRK